MRLKVSPEKKCAIKLEGIKRTFVSGQVETHVLRGIDLEIYDGELTVILGASGSGKSTLLNLIGGIDKPNEGRIIFNGRDISAFDENELTEYRRRHVGFIFQFYNLVPTLNARENVEVSTEIADEFMDPVEALKLVGLEDRIEHFPAQMSGGQQQRVAIARALAKKPGIMLCDEPTGALDAKTGQMILSTLVDLNEKLGTTILIITHAATIAMLAHRIVHIGSGVITKVEEVKNRLKVGEISW
jgi:putative ABC transport system ATP-binding protein